MREINIGKLKAFMLIYDSITHIAFTVLYRTLRCVYVTLFLKIKFSEVNQIKYELGTSYRRSVTKYQHYFISGYVTLLDHM